MLPQTGPSWQFIFGCIWTVALTVISWLQKRSSDDRKEMKDELSKLGETTQALRNEVTVLNTHVGVEGNGILTRLDEMNRKLDRMSEMFFTGKRVQNPTGGV